MSFRRVKEVSYNDEDEGYDEYGEDAEDELAPEDKEKLEVGTVAVRAELDPDIIVSDKEIQDALWHYYYDIGKSVTYIKNLKKPQPKQEKKKQTLNRFDQAANAAASKSSPKANNLTKSNKKDTAPAQNEAAQSMAALTLQDTPKVKSKNLNVLEEFEKAKMKDAASFVVVGHVDHGKSTLMGRLLYDLKVVDEKTVDKLRRDSKKIGKASFALAWVMDATSDERERGITVDVATNYFETDQTRFTILDAPGHQDFVPNMIAGASQADFAVLVVDASTNNFESGLRGQTKEHAMLVRSLGVQRLVVAVNKMDTTNWSEERFNEIKREMTAFLTASNFSPKNVSYIPCAGLTGENIVAPVSPTKAPWYSGPTLVHELDAAEPTKRAMAKPLRLTIAEVFSSSPNNPVSVSGRIDAGSVQAGDRIKVLPGGATAAVKSIEADGAPRDWAVAGQIVVLNLADVDRAGLKHGDVVALANDPLRNRAAFVAKILAFEHVVPGFVDVHRGPMQAPGKVAKLVAVLNKASGEVEKKKPKVVQPGAVARVVVELESEMPIEAGNRVVLRSEGKSIAAGLVE